MPMKRRTEKKPLELEGRGLTLLLAFLTALTSLAIDMSLPAMPQFERSFNAGVAPVQLTLSLFLLGYALGQLVSGSLSDRVGRRPVLLVGISIYTVMGLLCAASTSLTMLIICRFVQGLAAAVGPIMARAIVRDRFTAREASAVLSQMTQIMIIVPILAPTLGGYLLLWFGWQSIFLAQGLGSLVLLVICYRVLPETLAYKQPEAGRIGFVLKGLGQVIAHRPTLRHSLANGLTYAGMFAYVAGAPFVLTQVFGIPEQKFGLYFAATAAAYMVGASINRVLLTKFSTAALLRYGINIVLTASAFLVTLSWFKIGGLAGLMLPMMTYMVGMGLVQPNATAMAMAPHGKLAGLTASLLGGIQTAGGAIAGYFVGAFYSQSSFSLAATVALLSVATFFCRDNTPESSRLSQAKLAEAETEATLTVQESGI